MNRKNLSAICRQMAEDTQIRNASDSNEFHRLVHPEYSKSSIEVKRFPDKETLPVFAICWIFGGNHSLKSTMISSNSFCCSIPIYDSFMTQQHTHDYIELSYVVQGQLRQRISGKDVIFKEGELCLIDRNCSHQDLRSPSSSIILFLGISNQFFREIMDVGISQEKITLFLQDALLEQKKVHQYLHFRPDEDSAVMENTLDFLINELISPNIGVTHICKGLVKRIFYLLSRNYSFSLSKEQQKSRNMLVYESVKEYISLHYDDISIQDLVNRFHFQEDYFNRLFKNKTGLTYSGYLQEVRMQKATELLLHSGKSIQEIVEDVGYHNKGYFYHLFFKKYGKTPHQFRLSSDRG